MRSQFGCTQLVRTGSIASLSLLLSVGLSPAFAQSPGQTGDTQTSAPASAPSPGNRTILKPGSQGDSVSDLQALLKLMGFYTGAIDGVYRDSTAGAVAAFQQAAGLQADGIVGSETWAKLLPSSPGVTAVNSAPSAATPSAASSVNGAIATSTAASTPRPAASNPFPSPAASANSPFPSPTASPASGTAQAPAPSSTPQTPAPSSTPQTPASQTPTPQTPTPQTATPQPADSASPTSAQVELPILRMGMRGSAVNGLQERLKAIGAFKGAIDGVFGAETQEAVKTAQRNFSLEPDGIVGPETWMALLRE
ncbi:MAG TPA: peptidoglycan-binding protein [Coleofasciculaceae cyanobacterium]